VVANTDTYLDSPFYRYADSDDLSELPLERPRIVARCDDWSERAITRSAFEDLDVAGKAVR
jgi:hypothetical protein